MCREWTQGLFRASPFERDLKNTVPASICCGFGIYWHRQFHHSGISEIGCYDHHLYCIFGRGELHILLIHSKLCCHVHSVFGFKDLDNRFRIIYVYIALFIFLVLRKRGMSYLETLYIRLFADLLKYGITIDKGLTKVIASLENMDSKC